MRMIVVVCSIAAVLVGASAAGGQTAAPTHRNACHTKHTCPSDHHTYVWRGLNCAVKTSPKYNPARDKIVRTYAGRRYYCRRAS